MTALYQSFLLLLARATEKELAHFLEYLKAENRVLRDKLPKRLTITPQERRQLIRYGKPLGAAIKDLITIVTPRTFFRWLQDDEPGARKSPPRGVGRPRTAFSLRDLIFRIASDTGWGYSRILGELKKLGLGSVCRTTVKNILRENGFDTGPKRGEGTWSDFIQRHAETLWACDFFSKKVWTCTGLVDVFVLFFIHVDSRRVHVAGMTAHPDAAWMTQQARNLAMFFADQPVAPKYLLRDNDTKFAQQFDAILEAEGITVVRTAYRAPNQNAYAERWVQSIKHECLDHFVVFVEEHLRYLVREYVAYYHEARPHQSKGNRPLSLAMPPSDEPADSNEVVCEERLGGLLKHYQRRAA